MEVFMGHQLEMVDFPLLMAYLGGKKKLTTSLRLE
jgi:hypothetical protein